ncbi:DUF4214 domain-containing protein [Methylobacterium sp. E-016]|uniref:beta strand repeat-containing protein n=1 Tax=Methylobacterium sp. E-016 TaxID=2836556 RepID=UPI001FBBA722|nr:DUF4214 domain-containing protein [Methylobacterium sp. E-016]MCJ2074778.1 DUF4214 domain-containing protein [Methylobacterium sp. E-016]
MLTNSGSITGGVGGAEGFHSNSGQGGAGVVGSGLSINNAGGTISGGFANNGTGQRADAITFTGGFNTLYGTGTLNGGIGVTGSLSIIGVATLIPGGGIRTADVTLSNVIHDYTAGSGSLVFSDSGKVTLTAANTYTGSTVVTGASTLALSGDGSIAQSRSVGVDGTFDISGATNDTTIKALTGSGNVVLGTHTLNVAGASPNSQFSGVIAGMGGFTVSGGTMVLTGPNTYAGATTVSAGILNIRNNTSLGAIDGATAVAMGATLQIQNGITVGAEALSLSGTGVGNAGALENVAGNNTYGGAITLGSSARINSDTGSLTLTGGISGNAAGRTLTLGGAGNGEVSTVGITAVTGGIVKDGAGTWTLSADNTYGGPTVINSGTLQLGNGGTLAANSAITIGSFGTLAINHSDTLTLANAISGNGRLTQAGAGTLILTGADSHGGATAVQNGALLVNTVSTGIGTVTVDALAKFGGTGSVASAVTVSGTISAGTLTNGMMNTVGEFTTSSLTLSAANGATPTFHEDVGARAGAAANADLIHVRGTVALAGLLDFSAPMDFSGSVGQSLTLIDNDSTADAVTGRFTSLHVNGATVALAANDTFNLQGHSYLIDYRGGDGNDVVIRDVTPAPTEPTQPTQPTQPTPTQPTGPTPQPANAPAFGDTVTDTSSPTGMAVSGVYGLYKALLGRTPDPLGLETYTTALQNGATLTDVANALLGSAEHTGSNPATDPNGYVQGLYQNLLGRAADASGLQTFTGELAAGVSPATVAQQLATSTEAQNLLRPTFQAGVYVPDASESGVARLYYGLLGRAPDAGGLQALSNFVENGGGGAAGEAARLAQAATTILNSTEYAGRNPSGSDLAFVNGLYQGALGRSPEAGGAAFYIDQLAHGVTRATVALEIAQSPEAQVHLVGVIEGGFQLTM